ncbi:hypothetical protein CA984_13700 [Streptosporangium minutum]|uniref:Uncharacterized protein n=1 Tax=Streptosporangium minutum TaxID=569862 RepID=A0A243RP85_9ACTN|nr:hypothetical protein CA984_13700 [Streptosporangium minutum]
MPHVFFTPMADEIGWAKERTAGPEVVPALKCFQKMACFRPPTSGHGIIYAVRQLQSVPL